MDTLTGRTLGAYRLIESVGMGGMAVVYKAYDPALDRYVAIKLLPPYLRLDPDFPVRFHAEARNIARLHHPNILPIYGYGEEDGLSYFAMALVAGGTLGDLMGTAMEVDRAVSLTVTIADALNYAHSEGIVHRDVKPANVLMARPDWPLLSDFGIARMLEQNISLTRSGSAFLGTPHYMAPEQGRGEKITPQTDQYALGTVLYEMLTGTPPYHADTPQAIVFQHMFATPPLPRSRNPAIPRGIESVILRTLAKGPADRFSDMSAFARALQAAAAGTVFSPGDQAPNINDTSGGVDPAPSEPRLSTEQIDPTPINRFVQTVRSVAVSGRPSRTLRQPATSVLRIAGALMAVVLVAAAGIAILHRSSSPKHSPPAPPMALRVTGSQHGSLFDSGQTVILAWTTVPGASSYRLQVATWPGDPTDATVFRHPLRTVLIHGTRAALKVLGAQTYYWRVQVETSGLWHEFTRSTHFGVARPAIGTPRLLRPANQASQTAGRVTLCWRPVKGAAGYKVWISGRRPQSVKGTCTRLSVTARTYTWKVAASVRGTRVYRGKASGPWRFVVEPQGAPGAPPATVSPPTAVPLPTSTPKPAATRQPRTVPKSAITRSAAQPTRATRPTPSRRPTPAPTPIPTRPRPTPVPRATATSVGNTAARYTAVWHQSSDGEKQVYGLSYKVYRATYDKLWTQGWRLKLLSIYVADGHAYYTVVWHQSSEGEIQVYGLSYKDYRATYDRLWTQGWRLKLLSIYVVDGHVYYTAVWYPSNEGEKQVYGLSYKDYRATYDKLWTQGWRLKLLSIYVVDGHVYYTAVWRPSSEGEIQLYGSNYKDYRATYDRLWTQGWRLKLLSIYVVDGRAYYTAVWRPSSEGEIQVYGSSYKDYRVTFDRLWTQGWRLELLSTYVSSGAR